MNDYDGLNTIGDNAGGFAAGRTADVEPDVSEFARRLRMTAQHLAKFLEEQYERLDSAARQCEQVIAEKEALDNAKAEFEQRNREWETNRARREEEIRQEQDRLIAAWQTIETHQRKAMAGVPTAPNGVMAHPTSPLAPPAPAPAAPPPIPQQIAQPQPNPAPQPAPAAAPGPFRPDPSMPILETDDHSYIAAAAATSDHVFAAPAVTAPAMVAQPVTARPVASNPISREAALDQFQRLKREIRTHSQRSQQTFQD